MVRGTRLGITPAMRAANQAAMARSASRGSSGSGRSSGT